MRILGLNFSIDAAAALVVDGALVAAACEERFDRQTHSKNFPLRALRFCLEQGDLELDALDAVAFFWNPALQLDSLPGNQIERYRHHAEYLFQAPAQLARISSIGPSRYTLLEIDRGAGRRPLRIYYVTHHLCHASLAWALSGFDEAAVLTLDGYGEHSAGLLGQVGADGITVHGELRFPHSIGSVYAAVTEHLGFRANAGEGKVMGLAAYGTPRFKQAFDAVMRPIAGGVEVDLSYFQYMLPRPRRVSDRFIETFGPAREAEGPITERDQDLAATLQARTEDCLLSLARELRERTGLPRLLYSGGVALNSLANGKLAAAGIFDALSIPAASSDAGAAAGAAFYVHRLLGGTFAPPPRSDALGPEESPETIEALLRHSGYSFSRPEAIEQQTGRAIADGAIVGWFQGRMEFGPRALGQRSILGDPRTMRTFERLNSEIKFRESFRPYAPAILAEEVGRFFEPALDCPLMLKVLTVRPEMRESIPAVTHADGTARVQTVDADRLPLYHGAISAFAEKTGVPILLNTSFNVRGEPIVCRASEALAMFARTGLDALALGPFWVSKR